MNRIESGTEEALRSESYDQAATAVAAFYAGLPFPPLSLTKQRAEGWRYRDDILETFEGAHPVDAAIDSERIKMMMAVYSVGSAAQHVLQNYEHPMDQLAAETGAHNVGGEFVTKHWREIEAVAKALFERRDMSVEEVTKTFEAVTFSHGAYREAGAAEGVRNAKRKALIRCPGPNQGPSKLGG